MSIFTKETAAAANNMSYEWSHDRLVALPNEVRYDVAKEIVTELERWQLVVPEFLRRAVDDPGYYMAARAELLEQSVKYV